MASSSGLASSSLRIASAKRATFTLWLLVNLAIFLLAHVSRWLSEYLACLLVTILTPFYIWVVHEVDEYHHCIGLRCMRKVVQAAGTAGESFRRTLRLEMLVITSGFAATLFILSVQLYLELDAATQPVFVLEVMAVLFFLASLLNLLQLLLHDFKLSGDMNKDPLKDLRSCIDERLKFLMDLSWHTLVSPIILALALLDSRLCIAVNALYGALLFYYYFLPVSPPIVDLHEETLEKRRAHDSLTTTSPPPAPSSA